MHRVQTAVCLFHHHHHSSKPSQSRLLSTPCTTAFSKAQARFRFVCHIGLSRSHDFDGHDIPIFLAIVHPRKQLDDAHATTAVTNTIRYQPQHTECRTQSLTQIACSFLASGASSPRIASTDYLDPGSLAPTSLFVFDCPLGLTSDSSMD